MISCHGAHQRIHDKNDCPERAQEQESHDTVPVCLADKDIKQAKWPIDRFTIHDLEALDEAGLAMFSRASGVTNTTSFARLANLIANRADATPDQQLVAMYLLTKTVLALPLEDVQGGAGGGLPHTRYRQAVQQERLKLFAQGKWKELYDLAMALAEQHKKSKLKDVGTMEERWRGYEHKVASGNAGAGLGDQMRRTTLPHDTLASELKNALDPTPGREVRVKAKYGATERFQATVPMVQDALKGLKHVSGGTVESTKLWHDLSRTRQPLCSTCQPDPHGLSLV